MSPKISVWTGATNKIICIALGLFLSELCFPESPSFNCKNATQLDEKLICTNSALSTLDSQLAELFKTYKAELPDDERKALSLNQKEWLLGRKDQADKQWYGANGIVITEKGIIDRLKNNFETRIKDIENVRKSRINALKTLQLSDETIESFKNYSNKKYKFEIKYPKSARFTATDFQSRDLGISWSHIEAQDGEVVDDSGPIVRIVLSETVPTEVWIGVNWDAQKKQLCNFSKEKIKINDRYFAKGYVPLGTMGGGRDCTSYRTFFRDNCFSIELCGTYWRDGEELFELLSKKIDTVARRKAQAVIDTFKFSD